MKTLLILLALAVPASAQSLLKKDDKGRSPSAYDPPKRPPYKKHDLLQILVVERSKALSSSDLRTDRRSRTEIEIDKFVEFTRRDGKALPRPHAADLTDEPGIGLDGRYRQDNSGRTARNFDLTITVSAEVVDVRENGNLVIQARKRRKVNDDEEIIKLTGEVAPSMIVNNVVKSDAIANLDVSYEGKGSASDPSNSPGWLGKVMGWIWPF